MRKTVTVVLPAFNEAKAIGKVLAGIPASIGSMDVRIIVVDDGSTDHTAEVARRHGAKVIRHITNLGAGAATVTGMQAAKVLGADIIVTIDADGQHNPADIQLLVESLVDGPYDVVIGSRLLDPVGMPASRFGANLLLNGVTFFAHGKIVSDSQSGFKAYSREAIEVMELSSPGYEICSEIIGEIYRKNLRYKSVPIKAVYTDYSKAKGQHFLNGVNLILGLLIRMLRRA
ncbi:MAG: glycosyltransferase family 2 protein [Acidobacteria bacterium]|nr:MAG: glycosyltransferase family 2 protein [Acidobacteriota bacterium]